jgi:Glycosyl transferases group 1
MSQTPALPAHGKPKLLFFQFAYDEQLPKFILTHRSEHVACLEQFFDVVVVTQDCSLDRMCDLHQPELILVEGGVPNPACRRPQVSALHTHRHIPRLGLMHADAFCSGRSGFLSDMDAWGIETYFCIAVAAPAYNTAIEGRLFVWPNFVDSTVFRDYGQDKTIPVLFAGNRNPLYPWRRRVLRALDPFYDSSSLAHPGYSLRSSTQYVHGESYARLLNSAWFVPSCGTVAKDVVRKHFEAPASKACLVTERTRLLEHAGFVDMENCVFADESDAAHKIETLLEDKARLLAVIQRGHALVHSRHTMKHRSQIHDWFLLNRRRQDGELIVQPDPFARLELAAAPLKRQWVHEDRRQLTLLREGDEAFARGETASAAQSYRQCASFVRYMPEPRLRMALCHLQRGEAPHALQIIKGLLHFNLLSYRARDPDPIEFALLLLCLLCMGKADDAARFCEAFAWVRQPELDRTRSLVRAATRQPTRQYAQSDVVATQRLSLHQLPWVGETAWRHAVTSLLAANNQTSTLAALTALDWAPAQQPSEHGTMGLDSDRSTAAVLDMLRRAHRLDATREHVRARSRAASSWIERKLAAYVLPYRFSSVKYEPFFLQLSEVVSDENTKVILTLDDRPHSHATSCIESALSESLSSHHSLFRSPTQLQNAEKAQLPRADVAYLYLGNMTGEQLEELPWSYLLSASFLFIEGLSERNRAPVLSRIEAIGAYGRSPDSHPTTHGRAMFVHRAAAHRPIAQAIEPRV